MRSPGRLFVLSHRAPVEVSRNAGVRPRRAVGGLPGALNAAMQKHGGMWVAWAARSAEEVLAPADTGLEYPVRSVRLKERDATTFYAGFANQVLWPLCHMLPNRCRFQPAFWTAYQQANERFAAAVRADAGGLRVNLGADVILLGVDRLDYTKGIPDRLLGFERFLERHPEWRRRVSLVQIAVPSEFHVPEFREMKRTIDEIVGRIIGRFSFEGRSPLVYIYTAFDPEQLAAYYVAADVALITPLRDGMNLVAKEYVAG